MKDDNIIKFGVKKEAKRKTNKAKEEVKPSGRRETDKDTFDVMVEYQEQVDELEKENAKLQAKAKTSIGEHAAYYGSLIIYLLTIIILYFYNQ